MVKDVVELCSFLEGIFDSGNVVTSKMGRPQKKKKKNPRSPFHPILNGIFSPFLAKEGN